MHYALVLHNACSIEYGVSCAKYHALVGTLIHITTFLFVRGTMTILVTIFDKNWVLQEGAVTTAAARMNQHMCIVHSNNINSNAACQGNDNVCSLVKPPVSQNQLDTNNYLQISHELLYGLLQPDLDMATLQPTTNDSNTLKKPIFTAAAAYGESRYILSLPRCATT